MCLRRSGLSFGASQTACDSHPPPHQLSHILPHSHANPHRRRNHEPGHTTRSPHPMPTLMPISVLAVSPRARRLHDPNASTVIPAIANFNTRRNVARSLLLVAPRSDPCGSPLRHVGSSASDGFRNCRGPLCASIAVRASPSTDVLRYLGTETRCRRPDAFAPLSIRTNPASPVPDSACSPVIHHRERNLRFWSSARNPAISKRPLLRMQCSRPGGKHMA